MTAHHIADLSKSAIALPSLVPPEAARKAAPRPADLPADLPAERGRDRFVHATVLSIGNIHEHGELFINYLKMRREVFIRGKGWALPEVDGMEFDQYDTPQARWIVLHEYGEILAGIRIAPTTARCGPNSYMIRDAQLGLLPDLPCDCLFFEAPVNETIWEATRLFVSPEVGSERRLRIQLRLMVAMAEAGRAVGARQVIGIVPAVFRRWMNRIGMSATAIGPGMRIGDDRVQAALMDIALPKEERPGLTLVA